MHLLLPTQRQKRQKEKEEWVVADSRRTHAARSTHSTRAQHCKLQQQQARTYPARLPKKPFLPPQKQTRNDVFYVPTNVRYVSLLAYVLVMRTALLRHAHCTRKRKKMVGGNNGPLCYFEGTQPVGFLFCLTRKISWKMTNS